MQIYPRPYLGMFRSFLQDFARRENKFRFTLAENTALYVVVDFAYYKRLIFCQVTPGVLLNKCLMTTEKLSLFPLFSIYNIYNICCVVV
jgi:hypothetical protein